MTERPSGIQPLAAAEAASSPSGQGADAQAADLDLRALARRGTVHFVGIAGAGMSALADLLLGAGGRVSGCDLRPGAVGEALRRRGADLVTGHDPAHVEDAVAVVTTAAVPPDHPELAAARRRGIPVLKRAAALGAIVNTGTVVALAGTHGKTTTTAMTTAILEEGGLDPTGFVGGRVPGWDGGLRRGGDRIFVVEADEYDRSFLTLKPDTAVVTTLEADHLDVYGSLDAVEAAFGEFLERVAADGVIAICLDDPGARRLLGRRARARQIAYGTSPEAQLQAVGTELRGGGSRFRVVESNRELGELTLPVPGLHNVRNALGALAAALALGVDFEAARRALGAFGGVDRRFQILGRVAGVTVVDDYAHHPTEVEATLTAARGAFPEARLVAVFQPHLYTRTRDFAEQFGRALRAADEVWVTDVYPAREAPIPGVTGENVAESARRYGAPSVRYHPATAGLDVELASSLRPGDVCLTMGAGDIDATAKSLLARLGAAAS